MAHLLALDEEHGEVEEHRGDTEGEQHFVHQSDYFA